jgi:hypothetical protein
MSVHANKRPRAHCTSETAHAASPLAGTPRPSRSQPAAAAARPSATTTTARNTAGNPSVSTYCAITTPRCPAYVDIRSAADERTSVDEERIARPAIHEIV